jgi:hypothetical protein
MRSNASSDEDLIRSVEAYETHGTQVKAAAALGINQGSFSVRLKRAAERGLMGTKPVLPGFRITQTSTQTDEDGALERQWVKQKPDAGEEFLLPDGHVIKGVSALVDPGNRVLAQWIKTKADTTTPDLVAALKAVFDGYAGRSELIPFPDHAFNSDLMSVYPIADQHNGLLAWGRETGEDYDLKIGAERLRSCASRLIAQSPPSDTAIVLNLGDWQHTDDQKNMTPRGNNLLDVDSRYFKILQAGVQLMCDVIELALQKHARVLVRNIPGNHDPHASIALTVALGAFYHNNPRVTVDDSPSDFFFHRFGATLIGATHGHKCKPDKMAMTMAVECREDWGATKYHWMLYGHIHHETAKEVGDVRCESFQTLAAKDAYAASHGYNAGKSLNSITLHREEGEIGRHRINVPPAPRMAA